MDKTTVTSYSTSDKKGDFTSTTTTTTTTNTSDTHLNNSMSANSIHISSNSSIKAYNLNIKSNAEVAMNAKDDITLSNLADSSSKDIQTHQETSGFKFSSEGDNYSASIGKETADISDKTSSSIHHKQNIEASSISISAGNKTSIESSNLIANNGDISISSSDVSITSLKDNFTHTRDEKHTSNTIGISVPKSYVDELGKAAGKSTLNAMGKGLQSLGDHLDPNNPNNVIASNHPGLYSTPGKWLSKGADKIKSPSLSEISHLEASIGFSHTDKSIHHNSSNTQNSSSDLIAKNISINAKNKADIIASNLNAQNDISLAGKNVNITSSANEALASNSTSSNTASIGISANIGKDTSLSAKASYDHSEHKDSSYEITHTASKLNAKNLHINTSEDTHIQGSFINAQDSTDIKAKTFTLSSSENKSSTQSSDSSVGGDLKVSYNGSFGGELNAHYNSNSTDTQSITHNASSLNTGKLTITTSEDSNIIGSSINAKQADITSQSLNISASKDSFSSNSKSNAASASIGANLSNLSSIALAGNIANTSSEESNTTYNNASLNVGNMKLNTQKDLNIKGGNITTDNLEANIKGDMNIQSLQDSHHQENKDLSLGASINTSSLKTFKPSFANSPSDRNTHQVKTQSGITAKNSLQINVQGNTDLKGAYINVDNNNNTKDSTPSVFTTNTLSSSDITNSSNLKDFQGIKGNTSSTLASISNNIHLEQKAPIQTQNTNIHRNSPSNQQTQEYSLPKKQEKSIFNGIEDIAKKTSNLIDKTHSSKKTNQTKDNSNKSFKDIAKQTFKTLDTSIDIAYSEGKPLVSSLGEFINTPEAKEIANAINHYTSFTHNTKEITKGIAKSFNHSAKENIKDTYSFAKPLSDSLTNTALNNTSDTLMDVIKNKDQAPKDIFKNAWKNTEKQSNDALNAFTHKILWE